jgi:hypothetical protein
MHPSASSKILQICDVNEKYGLQMEIIQYRWKIYKTVASGSNELGCYEVPLTTR